MVIDTEKEIFDKKLPCERVSPFNRTIRECKKRNEELIKTTLRLYQRARPNKS